MNAVEFVLRIQELKPLHVPRHVARVRHDLEIFHGSNQSLLLLLEIPLVGERQHSRSPLEHLQRKFRWSFALRMEVSFQRSRFLSVCGALVEDQVTDYGEGCSRSRKGLDELSSSRHRFFSVWHLRHKGPFLILLGKYRPCRIEGCQTWASARPEAAHWRHSGGLSE